MLKTLQLPDGNASVMTQGQRRARVVKFVRKKPYLVDNRLLGKKFKQHFVAGLKRLHAKRLIAFDPPVLPGEGAPDFTQWLDRIAGQAWNVFIEPPPKNSQPQHVAKYLARYLTGGPISDGRLISHEQDEVTFRARSKNKQTGNTPRPFTLSGVEFVRRWSLHILPKGFTKTRAYGGFSCRHRQDYMQRCRQLLRLADPQNQPPTPPLSEDELSQTTHTCLRCQSKMVCVSSTLRPSWRDLFRDHATCPLWYQPSLSISRRFASRIRGPDHSTSVTR